MPQKIAIVGMACRYADARSPLEFWENILAQRRAFRRMPSERLRLEDYFSADPKVPDSTYSSMCAPLEGYEFDRVAFKIAGPTYRSADISHWLALDVASKALSDAGFADDRDLNGETAAVYLGNTLTGEFSRANAMRLRWPYVRRTVEAFISQEGWPRERVRGFIRELERAYKEPFPPVGEETLAGGMSNTIAGRICSHYDLKGGGYTVDGACSASLLAVATACVNLSIGEIDMALAGGVDLSMDPFEIVGFAKTRALAATNMRVYDARSEGFWPGEGCGLVVLMRYEDAVAQCRRIYAVIRGWGVSSDGSGGITRPEIEGQMLALRRAYKRAGYGIETVAYFEGHGTGTSYGDTTELKALTRAIREAAPVISPTAIGSAKANIGHAKAAAGVAGLIKAVMALQSQIVPPSTGCDEPHPVLREDNPALKVLARGESWPRDKPLRAGVSAMGFGGINTHITLEAAEVERRAALSRRDSSIICSPQDAEIFVLAAPSLDSLKAQVEQLLSYAGQLSFAELSDLAARLRRNLPDTASKMAVRAAIVSSAPFELEEQLKRLKGWIKEEAGIEIDPRNGCFFGPVEKSPRVGFLFPGQASPSNVHGGALRRRFSYVDELYSGADFPTGLETTHTSIAQPAIITASLAAKLVLDELRLDGEVAIGHSLGELCALHWGGAIDRQALIRIAAARGRIFSEIAKSNGSMASIKADYRQVEALLEDDRVVIAGINSPVQTVVSGETSALDGFIARARANNLAAVKLPVSHAFHSGMVAAAAPPLADYLRQEKLMPLRRAVISTVTGRSIPGHADLTDLLCRQVTSPVRFIDAVMEAAGGLDLLIEVGPGRVLTDMVKDFVSIPAIAIDAGGPSLKGLLQAAGAAFALGATVHFEALFEGRFTKPFDLEWKPRFLANPCEAAPLPQDNGAYDLPERQEPPDPEPHAALADEAGGSTLEMFRQIVAARAELPPSAVADDARLLDDLHLNSITVSQLVVEAARKLNLPPPAAPTDYATVTVAEAAKALDEIKNGAGADIRSTAAPGVDSWVRAFVVNDVESPLPPPTDLKNERGWRIISADDHPLRQALHKTFIPRGDGGVVVCLPPEPDEKVLGLLLDGARAVLNDGASYFILVQQDNGAASFAKTLHLEAPDVRTCVVNLPFDHPNAVDWLAAEAKAVTGFSQAHYDSEGVRRTPVLELLPFEEGPTGIPLDSGDVLLVTGGGKGITAECAFDLAMATGARLALMGRSDPARDADLRQNLERFNAAGVNFLYLPADVSDSEAVRGAVRQFESALGPITAFLHGAGVNEPRLLKSIDESSFLRTLEPKLMGARNVLAAIDPRRLKLFISFGSLIARAGMRGEGEYAVANEWLTALSDRWQKAHPHCRCVMIEWSVWSGIGMGERLGRIEALMQQGITAIPPDAGMSIFRELLSSQFSYGSVVVTGRFGRLPTLKMREIDLPLLRFLEQPLVVYPGVELVADAELSTDSDPYLSDHVFQGDRLLPGVIGLEAMAQAVTALAGKEAALTFEKVEFNRPVVVPEDAKVRIRLAALARDSCRIDVALRSEQTGFQVDHFRASCLVAKPAARSGQSQYATTQKVAPGRKIDLDPGRDLYGSILFHEGRFHRLRAYHHLAAKECFAEIAPDGLSVWFGQYLPAELILGDPGALDATIHAIQACIPHEKLLPVGVDRLHVKSMHGGAARYVRARERTRTGDHFVYDVEVIDETGGIASIWTGLRLRLVGHAPHRKEWSLALLAPYLERKIEELFDGVSVAVRLERFTNEKRRSRTRQAITRLIGDKASVRWRPDGKPLVVTEKELRVSSSHSGEITMVAAGAGAIGCDIESVTARAESDWKALLGPQRMALARLIARECGEEIQASCTRAWSAVECLKKAGSVYDAPLVMRDVRKDGWVVLGSGYLRIATQIVSVTSHEQEYALALLVGSEAQADKSAFA